MPCSAPEGAGPASAAGEVGAVSYTHLDVYKRQLLGIPAWVLWLIVLVVAMASELLTVNMTTIWFALGALAALIMSMFNVDTTLQIIAFIAVSLLCLLYTSRCV